MADCDYIIVLPGWEKSFGACIEILMAIKEGKKIFEYPSLTVMDISMSISIKTNEICSNNIVINNNMICTSCNHTCLKK